jgi:hypothetical protein
MLFKGKKVTICCALIGATIFYCQSLQLLPKSFREMNSQKQLLAIYGL